MREKKKKDNSLIYKQGVWEQFVETTKPALCPSELQEAFHNGRTTLISEHVYNTTKTRLPPVMA